MTLTRRAELSLSGRTEAETGIGTRPEPLQPNPFPPAFGPRFAPRVAAYMPIFVHLREAAKALVARSRDIGTGGVCVATRERFSFEAVESVSIEFPGRTLSTTARGCWQRCVEDEDAVLSGIQFLDSPLEVRSALSETVQKRAHELACFLDESESLAGLDLDDLFELAKFSRLRQIRSQRVIYRASDRSIESLFVVFRGSVAIRSTHDSATERILPQGSCFGGRSLIADLPSVDTCIAREDTQLLEVDVYAYRFLEFARPILARRVMRAILQWTLPNFE